MIVVFFWRIKIGQERLQYLQIIFKVTAKLKDKGNKTNAQAIPPRRYGLQLHLCRISAI